MRNAYKILFGKPERRCHIEDLGVDRRTILERIVLKDNRRVWTGFFPLRIGTSREQLRTRK
jgi:hypothetical protein